MLKIHFLHQNKLAFNLYQTYLLSTLEKNDLKYLNTSFLTILYQFLVKIFNLKQKLKGTFFVLHPNFSQVENPHKKIPFF